VSFNLRNLSLLLLNGFAPDGTSFLLDLAAERRLSRAVATGQPRRIFVRGRRAVIGFLELIEDLLGGSAGTPVLPEDGGRRRPLVIPL